MIKKLANSYKNNKSIFFLFFAIPLIINAAYNYSGNEDIWYMMKYGKYILNNGFPHTDILSMHNNLHIVVQQSFSNILYYIIYHLAGSYGIFILLECIVALYLFLIYKLCLLMSNNKFLSSILSIITVIMLELPNFILPRSQIFTFLFVIIVMYIMEAFIKNNKTKLIYFLPLISLLQINLHAAFWYILFIIIIPYLVQLTIEKNKNIFKILTLVIIMFLVGFINPYTYENVFFPFLNYNSYINQFIIELRPLTLSFGFTFDNIICLIISIILIIYIYYKKGRLEIRHLLLFGGITLMSLYTIRLSAIFIIVSIPILANYLKGIKYDFNNSKNKTHIAWILIITIIIIISFINSNRLVSKVYKEANFIKNNYGSNIRLYTEFNEGSYCEYIGLHPYIDTRAEIFMKKMNRKQDIIKEYNNLYRDNVNYDKFIKKYRFTHFLLEKNNNFYKYLDKNKKYNKVLSTKNYAIFKIKT